MIQKVEEKIHNHLLSVCFRSTELFKLQDTIYKNQHENWARVIYKGRNPGMIISGRKDASQENFLFRYDIKTKELTYREWNEVLSSFAYTQVDMLVESKSNKCSIDLVKVNPVFTSQLGKFKYMRHLIPKGEKKQLKQTA